MIRLVCSKGIEKDSPYVENLHRKTRLTGKVDGKERERGRATHKVMLVCRFLAIVARHTRHDGGSDTSLEHLLHWS